MIVTIHQPEYLPYIGFFDRISRADIFVILDNVQYQKNAFINRNKIKTFDGWQWLTVPVKQREALKNINEIEISNEIDWRVKHWKALLYNYNKAPYFKKYSDFFEKLYKQNWTSLANLDIYLIENIMDMLGLKKEIKKSSLLKANGKADDLLINICKELGADTYFSGPGGRGYMDLEKFKEQNINVVFQEFTHPVYAQQFGEFIPNLSIIDLLFNNENSKIFKTNY